MADLLCCAMGGYRAKGFNRPTLNLNCVRKTIVSPGSATEVDSVSQFNWLSEGQRFDTVFELCDNVGAGTSSVVKRAVRVQPSEAEERSVAVKCVNTADDDEVKSFVLGEYRLLQSLQHPSIVSVHALYVNSNYSLMVMDLCEDSVCSHVERMGALQESDAKDIFHQLLEAIGHLHSKRIVHRDVKPENLLLRNGGKKLKLADFNSATRIGIGGAATKMLSARGDNFYSAPEVLSGNMWNERIDIWACGLSLFYMLRAALPFDCTVVKVKKTLVGGQTPEVAWTDLSQMVCNLIQQTLTVDMRDRPPALELLQHSFFGAPCVRRPRSLSSWEPVAKIDVAKDIQRQYSTPDLKWSDGAGSASDALRRLQLCKLARTTSAVQALAANGQKGLIASTQ